MKNLEFFKTDSKLFRLEGEKTKIFLHGQLSNSIKDLKSGESSYNLMLTLKGKVIADLFVYCEENAILISVSEKFAERVLENFSKLAPLSRVTIKSEPFSVWHVLGEVRPESDLAFRTERLGVPGWDVVAENFSPESGRELSGKEVEFRRVKSGMPLVGRDVTEDNLPQEGRLDRALHFNKGCYVGQEVIARLHFRGHVNKILGHFSCQGNADGISEIVDSQGEKMGGVTSAVFDESSGESFVLGYVPFKLTAEEKLFVADKPLRRLN